MPSTGGDEPGLGTLWGVFLPCTQNILGVILFIRLPFIVGQAGIWLTMAVIACCVLTTVLTSLSLSAIATNGRIKAGGPYFAISRNLGAPMGGAVGLLFYLGTTLGATMYVLGAVEALQVGFGLTDLFPMDRELLAVGTMLLLGACVFMGVAFVSRIAPVFLAVVIVSILLGLTGVVLFAAGVDYGQPEDIASASSLALGAEFQPDPDTGATPSFVSLLGLFYPSVTGIMAGANRSGVLANPGQSIPLGTLGAIGTTTALYLLVTWLYGAFVDRATLIANKLVFASLAWPIRYIVNVGIVMSSIGAGMQSLTGAPQLLAVMRRDGVVPSIPTPAWLRNLWAADTPSTDSSAHSKGESAAGSSSAEAGVPEVLITVVLAALPCLAGNIDNITPIQTIFFLMLYGSINLACLVLALLRTPNFRPVWRHFAWWTCAAGVLACAAIMMLVSWWQALAGITVAVALYYWIQRTGESLQWGTWGDSIASVRLHQASTALLSLRSVAMHPKNWRPQLLVLTNTDADGVPTRPGLLHVAGQLKKGQGLTVVATVRQGSLLSLLNRAREEYRTLLHQLGEQGVSEGEATRTAARLLARGIENPSAAEIAAVTADAKGDDALMLEDPEIVVLRSAEAVMQKSMLSAGVDGFAQVVHSVHREDGLVSLLQTAGLGALSPNMVMLGWPGEIVQWEGEGEDQHPTLRDRAAAGQYVSLLKTSLAMRKSILVLKGDADPDLHSPVPMRGTIDIWWVRVDSGLLLLLPFLLTRHPKWAQCKLRLFAVVSASDASPGATKERLEAYLANARIVAEVYTVAIAGDVADAAVANRTLNLEARNLLAQVAHASTMTMAASDLKPETPSRTARRSVMDVFGAAPAQGGGGEGDASTTTGLDTMPAVAEEDGEAADTPEDAGTGEPSVARSQSLREQRLRHAMALNAAISQHSSGAALVVTNLFVSRSADAKTFMLETEVCTAGVARALLVRGTGGELVTSFETTLEGFVGLADRPEGFTESQVASEEGGVSADSETEGETAPLSPPRPSHRGSDAGAAAPALSLDAPPPATQPGEEGDGPSSGAARV